MRNILFCSFLFLMPCLVLNAQKKKVIDERTGVEIIFSTSQEMFPSSWYNGKIDGKAMSLDSSEIERSTKLVKKALKKYPAELIKNNLKKVYVLKKLEFYGVNYGGTNYSEKIYITNNGIDSNYTDAYIERTFHAEIASVLLSNYPHFLDKNNWTDINGKDFKYGYAQGYEALKSGKDSEVFDPKLNKKGFLDEYSMATMESDFYAFAKNIFLAKYNFWKIVSGNKQLKAKLALVIAFYNSIDNSFTLDYFKKISKD